MNKVNNKRNLKYMEQSAVNNQDMLSRGVKDSLNAYFTHGPRSSKRTDILNEFIENMVNQAIKTRYGEENMCHFTIKKEYAVKSTTKSGKKNCDVVVLKDDAPHIIFPIKFCMTNYSQNCYNYWENLTGEVSHLKWANHDVHIVPVNILMNKIPYLKKDNTIKHWEIVTYDNSFKIYENLAKHKLVHNNYNVILEVNHTCDVGEKFDKVPEIVNIVENLPFNEILSEII